MYRRLYITIQWPHVLTEYCILYINYLMYRLLYRYTAIQRDTSDLMYRHPSGGGRQPNYGIFLPPVAAGNPNMEDNHR